MAKRTRTEKCTKPQLNPSEIFAMPLDKTGYNWARVIFISLFQCQVAAAVTKISPPPSFPSQALWRKPQPHSGHSDTEK